MKTSRRQAIYSRWGVTALVATLLLLTAGSLLAAAYASMGHLNNHGADGIDFYSGPDEYLWAQHGAGTPTWTKAKGVIKNTWNDYDWSNFAFDTAHWFGLITDADPPRWQVTMRTIQPVRVYGDGTAPQQSNPSWYYRAEAAHWGYGQVENAPLVWDGAWFHVGNAESDADEVHWVEVNSTHQFPVVKKIRSSGELSNSQQDAEGMPIYDERTVDILSPGVIIYLKNLTDEARLVHRVFEAGLPVQQFRHQVELDVNEEPADAGLISVQAVAWDDGVGKIIDTFQFN